MKRITASNYRKDKLYANVARAVSEILAASDIVTPVEVLLRTQRITKQQYEDWRFGRIPYLETACAGNLSKLNRILRFLEQHARALGLTPSQTVYCQWGRRGGHITLRFTKCGDPKLEAAYARRYVAQARTSPGRPRGTSGSEPRAIGKGTSE